MEKSLSLSALVDADSCMGRYWTPRDVSTIESHLGCVFYELGCMDRSRCSRFDQLLKKVYVGRGVEGRSPRRVFVPSAGCFISTFAVCSRL